MRRYEVWPHPPSVDAKAFDAASKANTVLRAKHASSNIEPSQAIRWLHSSNLAQVLLQPPAVMVTFFAHLLLLFDIISVFTGACFSVALSCVQ